MTERGTLRSPRKFDRPSVRRATVSCMPLSCGLVLCSQMFERLALEFLEVFEPDRPLDQEEFKEWIQINSLSVEEVKEAAKEAVRKGWVEDRTDGLRLTGAGRQKTQE